MSVHLFNYKQPNKQSFDVDQLRVTGAGRSEPIESEKIALNNAIIYLAALELPGVTDSDCVALHQLRLDVTLSGSSLQFDELHRPETDLCREQREPNELHCLVALRCPYGGLQKTYFAQQFMECDCRTLYGGRPLRRGY